MDALTPSAPIGSPLALLAREGYAFVAGAEFRTLLGAYGSLADWDAFAASWERLALDRHMADRGRYRRRRHAVFSATAAGAIRREPHQPHFQSLEYNPLNGGVERWFEPVEASVAQGATLTTVLAAATALFGAPSPRGARWRIEVHQFRIEARVGAPGLPTPEGVHRDGVDWVLVLLVRRHNIVSGTTTVHGADRRLLGSFTLAEPCDAALVDDRRCFHGVTPVTPLDPSRPAWRDVLVVTLRAEAAAGGAR